MADEPSLEIVDAGEIYPKQSFTSDDGILTVPFNLLSGEGPLFRGRSSEGVIIITSYRLYHSEGTFINIPLGLIDYIECRDIFYLYIYCKDCRTFRCIFDNSDETQKWLKRIQSCIKLPDKIDHCFAFRFLSWTREEEKDGIVSQTHFNLGALLESKNSPVDDFTAEAERLGFDLKSGWKISKANENYQLCPSYPRYFIVPATTDEKVFSDLATFRYSKRFPAVVWRHQQNGCVIVRSSQPRMGIFGWREPQDEILIEAISLTCALNRSFEAKQNSGEKSDPVIERSLKKLLIVDARSYAAAVTNRAKGGGYESDVYYTNCEIQFMGLANIHAIRSSFFSLRALCFAPDDQSWLSALEGTKWLQHISGLIKAALLVVNAIDVEERPVLVHCSDGWDRTPQIVALAEIILDPYYRTKKGFQVLVEREWLEFGHKFADRCGHPDGTEDRNERCPVFLQWLDCIYQLLQQFQCHFEFNEQYLARLALHTYSCLFGTFLCNTDENRRRTYSVPLRTFSVWPVLNEKNKFHNYLYSPSTEVLKPSYQIRSLKFWSDLYLPSSSLNLGKSSIPPIEEPLVVGGTEKTNLVKTKSCDNIHSAEHSLNLQRRNSDPSLVENAFSASTLYPQLPEFSEKTLNRLPSPSVLAEEEEEPCVNEDVVCDLKDACERTDTKGSGDVVPSSNLVLREPAIDGSTDTLVSESGALIQEQCRSENSCRELQNPFPSLKLAFSVGTDTSDLPVFVDDVLQSVTQSLNHLDSRLPNWCQNFIGAYVGPKRNDVSNSCSCSYTTPNHSRTPSSGFPATPCDDPSDMPNLKKESSCQVMDFDGLNIFPNPVQERIKKLILHYKNKVGSLQMELSNTRFEFVQAMFRHSQGKEWHHCNDGDDAPSVADSASSGEHPVESGGSESSWDLIPEPPLLPDHATANSGMGM